MQTEPELGFRLLASGDKTFQQVRVSIPIPKDERADLAEKLSDSPVPLGFAGGGYCPALLADLGYRVQHRCRIGNRGLVVRRRVRRCRCVVDSVVWRGHDRAANKASS